MRPPVELLQCDDMACLSCVAANLWYMFGIIDEPDEEYADRILNRLPGEPAWKERFVIACLQYGLAVYSISPSDPERFVREGIDYLHELFGPKWTPGPYLTPKRIAAQRISIAKALVAQRQFPNSRLVVRIPQLDDIKKAVSTRRVAVEIGVDTGIRHLGHSVLVYRWERGRFWLYYPSDTGPTIRCYRESKLSKMWLPQSGISAIWRP